MALDINLIKADVEIRGYYESPYASIFKTSDRSAATGRAVKLLRRTRSPTGDLTGAQEGTSNYIEQVYPHYV